jgi:hypothetical protein
VARLAGSDAMAAALRLAHHGEGRVLVDLEDLERVGDEENVHCPQLLHKTGAPAAADPAPGGRGGTRQIEFQRMKSEVLKSARQRVGLVLACEGMGDCLFGQAVIRVMKRHSEYDFDLFTHQPALFKGCPYVENVFPLVDAQVKAYPHETARLFELDKLHHWAMDTFDFISIPLGLGTLTFRDKQLEYFPTEADEAQAYDVVLNTSMTWPTRSWAIENWQRLADELLALGFSVAVVGKDTLRRRTAW